MEEFSEIADPALRACHPRNQRIRFRIRLDQTIGRLHHHRQISERPITDVINVPAPIKCALLVRWGRKQKHLTQAQLAEELDMTQSQIAKIESAANGVTAEVLGKLAKALDVTFTITPNDPVLTKTSPKKAS